MVQKFQKTNKDKMNNEFEDCPGKHSASYRIVGEEIEGTAKAWIEEYE